MTNDNPHKLNLLIHEKVMGKPFPHGFTRWIEMPRYSTDIAAAWQVWEKMGESAQDLWMERNNGKTHIYKDYRAIDDGVTLAIHEDAPFAICLAALRLFKIPWPEETNQEVNQTNQEVNQTEHSYVQTDHSHPT